MMWSGKKVLVTGGASFIGGHLVDKLLLLGADVLVVDNMSSGSLDNLPIEHMTKNYRLRKADLRDKSVAISSMVEREVIFHLAADHGGRGYVDSHEIQCATNMTLDQAVMNAAASSRHVKFVVNASSACVYPVGLQTDKWEGDRLAENDVTRWMGGEKFGYDADHMYGWAKLMGEMVMNAHMDNGAFHGTSLRYFTVYGPRMGVSHAIGAWVAKARAQQDPFIIWGDGQQTRSWIYVDDVVEATVAAAENLMLDSYTNTAELTPRAINVGSPEHVKIVDAALLVMEQVTRQQNPEYECRIDFDRGQPTGPRHRAADVERAYDHLNWEPTTKLRDGIAKTIDWYFNKYSVEEAEQQLTKLKDR